MTEPLYCPEINEMKGKCLCGRIEFVIFESAQNIYKMNVAYSVFKKHSLLHMTSNSYLSYAE